MAVLRDNAVFHRPLTGGKLRWPEKARGRTIDLGDPKVFCFTRVTDAQEAHKVWEQWFGEGENDLLGCAGEYRPIFWGAAHERGVGRGGRRECNTQGRNTQ